MADVIVVSMTSNPVASAFGFSITSADLESGTLNRPGQVRVDKIYTLAQGIVIKTFGRVGSPVLKRIRTILQNIIDDKP